MKFLVLFVVLTVSVFLGLTQAQCRNAPQRLSCRGPPHRGLTGPQCRSGTRWYYNSNSRTCMSFRYNGCGGNRNRYCSLRACQNRCVRRD